MTQITIPLDDDSARRLRELASQRGESVEQTAQMLLRSSLPPETTAMPASDPAPGPQDGPDESQAILRMAGSLTWPGVAGPVTTSNEEIDRLLAEEAMGPHDADA